MPAITTITQDGFRSSVPLSSTVVIQSALEALTSNEGCIRCDAVIVLSKHIEAHPKLAQVLIDMLADAVPRVRIVTAGQLGNFASDISTGTAAVKNMLLKGSDEEKLAAAQLVAAKLPELSDLAFEVTKQIAAGGDTMGSGLKYAAIATLGEFHRVDDTSLRLIRAALAEPEYALQTDSQYYKYAALHACKHLGSAALPLAADILATLPPLCIKATSNHYYEDATKALGKMGIGVLPYLADAATAPINRDTYSVLLDTLLILAKSGSLSGQLDQVIRFWQKVTEATPAEHRYGGFLEELYTYGKESIDLLLQHATDEKSVLYMEAFRALSKFNDQSSEVFALMLKQTEGVTHSSSAALQPCAEAIIVTNGLINAGARPEPEVASLFALRILQALPSLIKSAYHFDFRQIVRKLGPAAVTGTTAALNAASDEYSKLGIFGRLGARAQDLSVIMRSALDQLKHIAVGDPAAIAAVGTLLNAKISKIVKSEARETLAALCGNK